MSDEHLTMILSYEVDQYQVMIKSKQLIQSLPKWREQATKLEMLLTDCVDYQCLRRERDVFITCMDNVDDASTTLVDMYMEAEVDIPMDMEDLEIYNYELVKRINSKMIMLKDTKSNVSKVSMISSSTFRRSDTGKQAAAIAAELEVKLQYMYMEAEQYELERNRNEKELAMSFEVDQYQVMIKSKQLIQSLPKWREQATKLEMLLTDCVDYQCLRRERDVLITCMDNVDDASTTFVDLYLDVDIPIDMEDLEICNYELVKRINSKMIMLKDTKSNVSKVSMISSSTFRRSDTGMQAAAIAAELEVKLQYVYMEAEQYELDRNRTEKELEIAKARLRAVNEVNGLQDVSQTQSVTIERLPYTNCIDGFMQLDSVHYPVNELDNQFEGNVVVPPGGCFGTRPLDFRAVNEVNGLQDVSQTQSVTIERLPYANCIDGFMQLDSVHYPVNELDNQFEGSVVVPPGGCFGTSPLDFRAVNEVNGLQDVSQTQSVTIEGLPYANCIDGFMQLDSVHYPVNELDNQFEGSVVVLPGGCFGTSPLDSGFGDTFVVGESCGDKLDWWHGVVSRESPGVHSFMNQDSVHYPVNEGDNQFEGSVVVPPGGCFGTSPLNVRLGDTFVVGESCGDKLDGFHGVVSREGPGLLGFADCPSRCETAIANRSNLGAFSDGREMQALQSKRSEWVGLSGPNVQLVISTKSATDEVASSQNISDPCVRGHNSDGIFKLPITAYTIPHIPINLSHIPTPDTARQWPHLEWIVHQLTPLQDVEFALLIGHNFNIALMSRDVVPSLNDEHYAQGKFWAGAYG